MIISCDFCGTTFKLADDKIKSGRTKFKCAKCKNIFVVKKGLTEAEQPAEKITADDSDVSSGGLESQAGTDQGLPRKDDSEEPIKSESEVEEAGTIDKSEESAPKEPSPGEPEISEEKPDISEDFMIDLPPEKTEEADQEKSEEEIPASDRAGNLDGDVLQADADDEPETTEKEPEQDDVSADFMIDLPDEGQEEGEAEGPQSPEETMESGEDEFPSLDDFGDLSGELEPAEELQDEPDITEDAFMALPDDDLSQSEHEGEELLSLDDIGNTDNHIASSLETPEDFDDNSEESEGFQGDSGDFLLDVAAEESTKSDSEPADAGSFDESGEIEDDIFPSFDDFGDLNDDLGMDEESDDEEESVFSSAELPDLDMPGNNEQEINDEEAAADISSFGEDGAAAESTMDEESFMWDESDSSELDGSEELFDVSGEGADSFDFESEIGSLDSGNAELDVMPSSEDAFGDEQSGSLSTETELELDEHAVAPQISEPDVDLPLASSEEKKTASSSVAAKIEPAGEIKSSKRGIIIALLVLFLSLGGAFYYVLASGENISIFGIDLKETMAKYGIAIGVPGMGKIELTDLKGYYFQAGSEGMIFVVEGNALNNYKEPRSFIRVKGNLYDSDGSLVMSKEAYGGNILSRNDLRNFSKGKVLKEMDYRVGKGLVNSNIAAGSKVPFMVVFYGVPDNLAEFDIEVVGSEDATKS